MSTNVRDVHCGGYWRKREEERKRKCLQACMPILSSHVGPCETMALCCSRPAAGCLSKARVQCEVKHGYRGGRERDREKEGRVKTALREGWKGGPAQPVLPLASSSFDSATK